MPSIRQKKAFKAIVENHGVISTTMRQVGYSANSAKNPKNLTESDGWKELMKEYLPDKLLAQKHLALLNKKETKRTFNQELGEWVEVSTGDVDTQAVSKGLEMAYKLKDKFAPDKTVNLNIEAEINPTKAIEIAQEYELKLKAQL